MNEIPVQFSSELKNIVLNNNYLTNSNACTNVHNALSVLDFWKKWWAKQWRGKKNHEGLKLQTPLAKSWKNFSFFGLRTTFEEKILAFSRLWRQADMFLNFLIFNKKIYAFGRHYLPVIIIFMPHLRISLSKISITSSKNLLFASRQFNGVVQYAGFSECSAGVKSNEFDGWISCSTSTSDSFELYSASPVS